MRNTGSARNTTPSVHDHRAPYPSPFGSSPPVPLSAMRRGGTTDGLEFPLSRRERGTGVTTARGWPQDSAQAGGMTWGARVRRAKSGVQEAQKNRSPDRSGPRLACGREPTRLLPVPTICVDLCEPSRTNTWVRRRRDSSPDLSGSSRAGCPITPRRRGTTPDREVAIPASCAAHTAVRLGRTYGTCATGIAHEYANLCGSAPR